MSKSRYLCISCGASSSSWSGRCFSCGEWDTLEEQSDYIAANGKPDKNQIKLETVSLESAKKSVDQRLKTGFKDVDQVLGGGIVAGGVVLLAGTPGVGKSTLLMQLSGGLSKHQRVCYISGEETSKQVASRAERLGVVTPKLLLATTNSADAVAAKILESEFDLVVVDSIQTLNTQSSGGVSGGVSQIVQSAHLLIEAAKRTNTALIIVGHVTKEGSIAGPKLLEHLVDVVLVLDGERATGFKILRADKNRYGSVEEIAIFDMHSQGLKPVLDPSKELLDQRVLEDGSVVYAGMEGNRPLLVEIQALTNRTAFGYPKRSSLGISINRLNMLIAVMEKRTNIDLSSTDVYLSVTGGLQIQDTAADLAICAAIGSSAKSLKPKVDTVLFGEVGLSGEIRRVHADQKRLAEAKKLGFNRVIGPSSKPARDLTNVTNLKSALNEYFKGV